MTKSRLYIVVLSWLSFSSSLIYGQVNHEYDEVQDFCNCRQDKTMDIDDIYQTFIDPVGFSQSGHALGNMHNHISTASYFRLSEKLDVDLYSGLEKSRDQTLVSELKKNIESYIQNSNPSNLDLLRRNMFCEIAIFLHTDYGNNANKTGFPEPNKFYLKLKSNSTSPLKYASQNPPSATRKIARTPQENLSDGENRHKNQLRKQADIISKLEKQIDSLKVSHEKIVNGFKKRELDKGRDASFISWLFFWLGLIAIISWLIYLRVPLVNFFIHQYNKLIVPKTKYSIRQNYADKFGFKLKSGSMNAEDKKALDQNIKIYIERLSKELFDKKYKQLDEIDSQLRSDWKKWEKIFKHIENNHISKDDFPSELSKDENLSILKDKLSLLSTPSSNLSTTNIKNSENDFSEWMEQYDDKLEHYDEKIKNLESKIPSNDLTPEIQKLVDRRLENYLKDNPPKEVINQENQITIKTISPLIEKKINELKYDLNRSIKHFKGEQQKTLEKIAKTPSRKSKSSDKEAEDFQKALSPIVTDVKELQQKTNSKTKEIEKSLQELTKKIENKNTSYDESVEKLQILVNVLETQLNASSNSRKILEKSIHEQKEELVFSKAEISNLQQELTEAQATNKTLTQSIKQQKLDLEHKYDGQFKTVKNELLKGNKIFREENKKELLDLKSELDAFRKLLKNKSVGGSSSVSKPTSTPTQKNPQNLDYRKKPTLPLTGNLKYSESPRNGTFYDKKLVSNPGDSHYYVLSIDENTKQGKFSIINNQETIRAASNYLDAVVLPSAEVSGSPNSGDLFEIIEHGTVIFDGKNWKIQDKMKIQF